MSWVDVTKRHLERESAEVREAGWGAIWDVTFMVGSVTRGWTTPAWDQPMTDPAWFTVARHVSNLDNWMISFSPMSSGHMVTLYKLAYDLKMKLKDLLIALIIGMIVLAFVFMPLDMFFMFHTKGGLSQITHLNSWWPWIAAGRYHRGRWVLEGLTWEYRLGVVYGGGILLSLVLYILKTRVPLFWFVNVPALFVGITIPTYMWMTSLIALIIKYISIRTVGLRKYEQYAMPVVADLILGFGAMWLPAALINLGGVVIPKSIDLYQP